MTKLKLIVLCVFSSALLAEEEFYNVVESSLYDTQIEEIGVISEPTILESVNMDSLDMVTFESEIKKEQEVNIVAPILDAKVVESNLSMEKSIHPMFTTFQKAIKIAKEENKIILLDVVANNCKFCERMEREVLSKDIVQEAIKKDFVLAYINEDEEDLPLGLSSQMTPMFVFISQTETVKDMRFGYIEEKKFLELLEEMSSKNN